MLAMADATDAIAKINSAMGASLRAKAKAYDNTFAVLTASSNAHSHSAAHVNGIAVRGVKANKASANMCLATIISLVVFAIALVIAKNS